MVAAKKNYGFEPDYAIPPGETLREVMESLGMSQQELARRTGITVQSLNRIFNGSQPITYETANRLELATGVPASMWNNLEAQYREQLAKINERARLETELAWLKEIFLLTDSFLFLPFRRQQQHLLGFLSAACRSPGWNFPDTQFSSPDLSGFCLR